MSWLSLLTVLLKLARSIMEWANNRRLLDAGRRAAINEQLAEINRIVAEAEAIEEEVAKKSDEEVDEELEDWYRD